MLSFNINRLNLDAAMLNAAYQTAIKQRTTGDIVKRLSQGRTLTRTGDGTRDGTGDGTGDGKCEWKGTPSPRR